MGLGGVVWQAVRFAVAFAAVLGLAAVSTRALARRARPVGGCFEVLGGTALGAGRQLLAVRAGRRILLLGLAERSLHLLGTVTDPEEMALFDRPGAGPSGAAEPFAAAMARLLRRARGVGETGADGRVGPQGGGQHGA